MAEQLSLSQFSIRALATAAGVTLLMFAGCAMAQSPPRLTAFDDKAKAALSLWEMGRSEFLSLIVLSDEERQYFLGMLDDSNVDDAEAKEGAALLLALNCVELPAEKTSHYILERYLCDDYPLVLLMSSAVASLHGLYMLSFVKEGDRARVIEFLERYVNFWRDQARREGFTVMGTSDLEYLLEILRFLREGGYNRPE